MKKVISIILAVICVALMTVTALPTSVLAESRAVIALSKATVTAGESVTVTVTVRTDKEIWSINGNLAFDNNVCSYKSASCTVNDQGNKISFVDTPDGQKVYTLTVELVAISAGTCGVSFNNCVYSDGTADIAVPNQSVNIKVNAPETAPSEPQSSAPATTTPAASANLTSLRVSGATLSPNFAVGRTSYTATVDYSVEKVTISATPADSKAKVSGIGSVNLSVGNNKKNVVVTATDGTKKTYTINIKRRAEGETEESENPEEQVNPLLVTIGEANFTIVQDISALVIPDGYTVGSEALTEETSVNVLKDEKYTLYYITDESGNDTALYTKNSKGEYERLSYMLLGNKLYIFEEVDENLTAPEGWFITEYAMTSGSVKAYQSQDTRLADFYWFYAYANGKSGFYCFDNAEGVMQRAPEFELVEALNASADVKEEKGIFAKLSAMSLYAKIVVALIALAVICIIALIVLLIVKINNRNIDNPSHFDAPAEDEFDIVGKEDAVLNAFANKPPVEEEIPTVSEEKVINIEDFDDGDIFN